jgi:hypothetical protein
VEFASLTGNQSICSWNAKSSRELFRYRKESIAVIARKEKVPHGLSGDIFQGQVSVLHGQNVGWQGFISDPRSRELAAPRGFTVGEGPLAAASPQTPDSGGTDSALRLVTCRSSDALRLPSSGQTGRFHPRPTLHRYALEPLKAAARYASPSSSCSISSS